ncbi:lysophospholipid acyltransferase family protein [Halalkalibaculum sp. DA384]
MAYLRVLARSVGFFTVTVGLYLGYLAGRGFLLLAGRDSITWRNAMVRRWAKSAAAIIRLDIEVEGMPPEPPFFMVCNHLSYLDVLPFFITTDCVFVAKSEVRSWPLLGRMAQDINVIFINRTLKRDIPRVNRLIEENISSRQGIIIFPEGTTTKGEKVKRFKSSLLQYAASRNFPVSYASITYATPGSEKSAEEWVCWWGDMTFLDHFFKMLTLPSIRAVVKFGSKKVSDNDRKVLARRLHRRVSDQFRPVVKGRQKIYE